MAQFADSNMEEFFDFNNASMHEQLSPAEGTGAETIAGLVGYPLASNGDEK